MAAEDLFVDSQVQAVSSQEEGETKKKRVVKTKKVIKVKVKPAEPTEVKEESKEENKRQEDKNGFREYSFN